MKVIFFDIDGVLRLLDEAVLGKPAPDWVVDVDGMDFIEYVSKHKHLLEEARPSVYVDVIKEEMKGMVLHFLTVQPKDWRPYTENWIERYFGDWDYVMIYCNNPEEKLRYLQNGCILFDDYPYEECPAGLYTVSRLYNLKIKNPKRIDTPEDMRRVIKKWKEVMVGGGDTCLIWKILSR